jgi:putative membrane protein
MMGWGWNDGSGAGTNWLWMGGMFVFWFAVIGIGIWLVFRLTDQRGSETRSSETPRAALDRRFASGEVNVDQYAEARRLLETKPLSRP